MKFPIRNERKIWSMYVIQFWYFLISDYNKHVDFSALVTSVFVKFSAD